MKQYPAPNSALQTPTSFASIVKRRAELVAKYQHVSKVVPESDPIPPEVVETFKDPQKELLGSIAGSDNFVIYYSTAGTEQAVPLEKTNLSVDSAFLDVFKQARGRLPMMFASGTSGRHDLWAEPVLIDTTYPDITKIIESAYPRSKNYNAGWGGFGDRLKFAIEHEASLGSPDNIEHVETVLNSWFPSKNWIDFFGDDGIGGINTHNNTYSLEILCKAVKVLKEAGATRVTFTRVADPSATESRNSNRVLRRNIVLGDELGHYIIVFENPNLPIKNLKSFPITADAEVMFGKYTK